MGGVSPEQTLPREAAELAMPQTDNKSVVFFTWEGLSLIKVLMVQKHCLSVLVICCMSGQHKNSVLLNNGLDGLNRGSDPLLLTLLPMQLLIISQHGAS